MPAAAFTKTLQPPTMDRVCAKQGVWSPNPPFCSMRPQNPTEQADNLQNKGFGPCKLRGLPAIYRVLYQTQGWGETLLFGGKHCPLWGVGESWHSMGEKLFDPHASGCEGLDIKNLLMPLFLRKGCFPEDFREGKWPIKGFGETAH